MRLKKVWHLCSNRWNSAITEYALRSAQALQRNSWQSFYSPLTGSPGARRAQEMELQGPHFEQFGPSAIPFFLRQLRLIQPDAIIVYGGPETFLCRAASRAIPKLRFRGQDSDVSGRPSGWKLRLSMQHCAGMLTPALKVRDHMTVCLGTKPVWAVPLGLDTRQFFYQNGALAQVERPTLRIVGRLDPIKGHQTILHCYRKLLDLWSKDLPPPFLEVIGQAANINEELLKLWARDLGLREGMDWGLCAERVKDLPERMRKTHLGLVPSLGSEVICRVAQEFLLSGCPIFVSGVGTLEECLFSEYAGGSFRGLNQDSTVLLLKAWLERAFLEEDQIRMGRSQEAADRYSLERMGQELGAILDALL